MYRRRAPAVERKVADLQQPLPAQKALQPQSEPAASVGIGQAPHQPGEPLKSGDVLALQRSVGNHAVSRMLKNTAPNGPAPSAGAARTIQRRGAPLDQKPLQDQASILIEDEYDEAIKQFDFLIAQYNSKPADNYGLQLDLLQQVKNAFQPKLRAWENANGPVTQVVKSGFFGMSSKDKRRLALKSIVDWFATEKGIVQQQGKNQATLKHTQDRATLQQYVNQAVASPDRLIHNSGEWIQAGKTKLYALTPTGDSYARLKTGAKNPNKDEAWFPRGTAGAPGALGEAAVTYNETDLTDNTNVILDDDGKVTGGWNSPGLIAVTNPASKTKEDVWGTLSHEVQHDSDKNAGRESQSGVRQRAEEKDAAATGPDKNSAQAGLEVEVALQRYKTEYRAYSYMSNNAYSGLDNSAQNQDRDGFMFSARQLAIFNHIYGGYAYTKTNWDSNPTMVDGRSFRKAVQEYWNPDTEGMNKYNSVRVDNLYLALDALGTKAPATTYETTKSKDIAPVTAKVTNQKDPGVLEVLKKINELTEEDATYIENEGVAMQKKIKAHLGGRALKAVENALRSKADHPLNLGSIFD